MIALGFDPGGVKSFGCASISVESGRVAETATVSSVDQAVEWSKHVRGHVVAVGIDTLMFWQTTPAGWRGADEWLRERYPRVKNSVASCNSLYGAMSVQGVLLARALEEQWPDALLTEAHPKVLWHHYSPERDYPQGEWSKVSFSDTWVERFIASNSSDGRLGEDEHQFDAILSAWAAINAYRGDWQLNLASFKATKQRGPNVTLCRQANYFWPSSPQ